MLPPRPFRRTRYTPPPRPPRPRRSSPRLPPASPRTRPASPRSTLCARSYPFRDASGRLAGANALIASSGILVDIDTNEVLWALEPHAQRAPASTTKLVSSIVALENFPPDRVVVVQPAAVVDNLVETRMGLHAGERLTIRELLSGMLTVSANDAAKAIADGTFGMDQYVEAMNQQVTALGLADSHFTNPVGYPDDPQMVSSAYDLAAFATAAYRNYPLFRELTAGPDANLPATPTHQEFKMHNINRLLDIYPPAVGTKSGYTDLAGPCLVSEAVRDNPPPEVRGPDELPEDVRPEQGPAGMGVQAGGPTRPVSPDRAPGGPGDLPGELAREGLGRLPGPRLPTPTDRARRAGPAGR